MKHIPRSAPAEFSAISLPGLGKRKKFDLWFHCALCGAAQCQPLAEHLHVHAIIQSADWSRGSNAMQLPPIQVYNFMFTCVIDVKMWEKCHLGGATVKEKQKKNPTRFCRWKCLVEMAWPLQVLTNKHSLQPRRAERHLRTHLEADCLHQ